MALKRTSLLLSSLNSKEKELLDFVIKSKKRKKIQLLHKFVKNKKNKAKLDDKALIYEAIFSEKYEKKKDYLLRNEIRLYNQELKEILAFSNLKKDDFSIKSAYLDEIGKRGLVDIKNQEINKLINSLDHETHYSKKATLLEQLISDNLKNFHYNTVYYKQLKDLLNEEFTINLKALNNTLSTNVLRRAYVERVLHQLTQEADYSKINVSFDLSDKKWSTEFSTFNYLKAKSYFQVGEEKISSLRESLKLLDSINESKIDIEKERVSIINSLATEHLIRGEYQDAKYYFEKCIASKDSLSELQFNQILLNYISTLTKTGDFDIANDLLFENQETILQSAIKDRIIPLAIGIHIFNGNIEIAEELMPAKIKEGDFDSYHYFRCLQIIIHFENEMIDLAVNECKNLTKHLKKYAENTNEIDRALCEVLINFIEGEFKYIDEKKIQKDKKVKQQLIEIEKQHGKFTADSIIMLWLKKRINLIE